MEKPLVYAVTLNWNRAQDTLECLESLRGQSYPNLRLLAVDNGSTDGSPERIAARFPEVELVCNAENLGFARGFNLGIRQALAAGADFVFIVNNDTIADPDCIRFLVEQAGPDSGALAPLIYYHADRDRIWASGAPVSEINLELSDPWAGRPDPGGWPASIDRDFLTGCALLLPRRALEQVGLFDEGFRMYYEDMDFARRIRRAGLSLMLVPRAKLWHKVATSSGGSNTPNERYWMARSSIRYFRKHATGLQKAAVLFWRAGSAVRTTLRLALQGRPEALKAYWRGLLDGWREERPA